MSLTNITYLVVTAIKYNVCFFFIVIDPDIEMIIEIYIHVS